MNQLETVVEIFAKNDKIFEHFATIYFKIFQALKAKGFSEEQAVTILSNISLTK
jgi:hypothetical protein